MEHQSPVSGRRKRGSIVPGRSYVGSRVDRVDATYGTQTESVTDISWLPFGPLESATLPGGATLTRSYNLRYQLEDLLVEDSQATDLVHRGYTYDHTVGGAEPDDPGPNLDRMVDQLDATESRFYFYDELDRLSRATDLSATDLFTYGYDAAGNRLSKTNAAGTTTYSYEAGSDRLATATGAEAAFYAHDAYGNQIYAGSSAYTGTPNRVYNDQNRLVSVIPAVGAPHDSVYDAFGRRVDGHGMVFVYDQAGRVLEASLRDGSSSFFGDLVWVEGELLGRVEDNVAVGTAAWVPPAVRPWLPGPDQLWLVAVGAGGTLLLFAWAIRTRSPRWGAAGATLALVMIAGIACVPNGVAFYWVVTDHLGTPIAMTNTPTSGEAKVIWKASYQPFGKAIEDLDPDGDGKSIRMPMRFPGQWSDFNTGLHYNFFRDYDPKTGRYLEADPIRQWGGANLYTYVFANPINAVDLMGLDSYLVCRPTNALDGALQNLFNHCFVANDANFPGDPSADVLAFGANREDLLDKNPKPYRDRAYWESVAARQCPAGPVRERAREGDVSFARIPTSDEEVRQDFGAFSANQSYDPTGIFGPNSNSGAFALANRRAEERVQPPSNGRFSWGAGSWRRVRFGGRR